jgi:hypothetical protein
MPTSPSLNWTRSVSTRIPFFPSDTLLLLFSLFF